MPLPKNRALIARERAGLSLGQAARLLGISEDDVRNTEQDDEICLQYADDLAYVYGVNKDWLLGKVPRYNYAILDGVKGADELPPHDRKVVAEFAASLPKRGSRGSGRPPIMRRK